MKAKRICLIILVVLWMSIVFYFSHQPGVGSSNTSKTVATKIVQMVDYKEKMDQAKKEEMIEKLDPYIRKLAHFSIYLLGGLLIASAVETRIAKESKIIFYAGVVGVIYALTDEVHQLFIVGRSGRLVDVVIDSLGVFTGIILFLILNVLLQRIKNRRMKTKGEE